MGSVLNKIIFLLVFFMILPAPAYSAPDNECLACHKDLKIKTKEGKSLLFSREEFLSSIHSKAGISCVNCHADLQGFKDFPHPEKLKAVSCSKCHPGAGKNFAKGKIHVISEKASNKWVYVVKVFYIILIPVSISLFIIFIAADLFHSLTQKLSTK